ncbi:hypothetical protein CERZMDRAFT_81915 [Cercospora zeae-maydis SCOH1-5]|uniref:Uncharacterized protein n=1 Tax=Cercospora zeae-maydis SCOH1-5 TaxID=717836 RepID=A0A6A6FR83_9PEZI|nr:hypothetical protein CERZMDRAFT_81915 [Cercospora zeae-maydis SCOH1-5]
MSSYSSSRPAQPRTPVRRCHAGTDATNVTQHHRFLSDFGKTYPTPPDSSPLQASNTRLDALVPVPLEPRKGEPRYTRKSKPSTPTKRGNSNNVAVFTPFHDIKRDIDDLIRKLPADVEDDATRGDEIVVERRQMRDSTRISLYLYSPSKNRSMPASNGLERTRTCSAKDHEPGVLHGADEGASQNIIVEHKPIPSLLGRARRKFRNIMLHIVPHGHSRNEMKRSSHVGISKMRRRQGPQHHVLEGTDGVIMSFEPNKARPIRLDQTPARVPNSVSRSRSLPVITANESLWRRRPEDMTSTLRKPLPTKQRPGTNSPSSIHEVKIEKVSIRSHARVQSQQVSIFDLTPLSRDIELRQAPISIKAAISLCVMAIAAGADFLVEEHQTRSRSKNKAVGYSRRRPFKWMPGSR